MFFRYNLLTILWAVFILVLILLPSQQLPKVDTHALLSIDKLAHAFVFSVLVLLMIVGFTKQSTYKGLRNNAVQYALYISIGYGIILEITQLLSSGRMVELYDGIANVVGCILGFGFFYVVYRI